MENEERDAKIDRLEKEVQRLYREIVELKRNTSGRALLAAIEEAQRRSR